MSEQESSRTANPPSDMDDATSSTSLSPTEIYALPVYDRPFFPQQNTIFTLEDAAYCKKALKHTLKTTHRCVALFFVERPSADAEQTPLDVQQFPEFGTLAEVLDMREVDGKTQIRVQGVKRVRAQHWIKHKAPQLMEADYPVTQEENSTDVKAHAEALEMAFKVLLHSPTYNAELKKRLSAFSAEDPGALADIAASICFNTGNELQVALNHVQLLPRLQYVFELVRDSIKLAKMKAELLESIHKKLDQRQRKFFLREQLKRIQSELGGNASDKEVDKFRRCLKDKNPPKHVKKRLKDEIKKLATLEIGMPDYAVTRNYLEHATKVPWGVYAQDQLDLSHAREVLNQHHAGLDDIKNRILELLAVSAFKGEVSGSIVLLVGPPGVGKTSVGKSIAESLGRPFYRLSVGGMRDEAEIKGHRRTYIGAMPGKLTQALSEAGVMNPVIMLDEIDKMGRSYQGDPASALLETLDPEQNANFLDHYLDLRLDLSKVLFICTANSLDGIPNALIDRMEIIRLAGYITEEKVAIARQHLWPKLLEKAGIPAARLDINDSTLHTLIERYARESGVRQLEKQLSKIIRKAAVALLDAPTPSSKIKIRNNTLEKYLGVPTFRKERHLQGVGIITGLAWTSMGGATLPIEATRVHCLSRGLKLTGQLGDVMKESAEIAYSYLSAQLAAYGAPAGFFDQALVHIHVPEGATPKDGPSAGISMASALLSLARNQAAKKNVAMTGELTLTGHVLAIGGVREKVIAARRQSLTELILPDANRGDFEELPDYLKDGMTVHFAKHFRDVVAVLFPMK